MDILPEKAATVDGVRVPVQCIRMIKSADSPDRYAHFHGFMEMLYLYDGSLIVWINGREYNFRQGEIIVINPNEGHALSSVLPQSRYHVIKFSTELLYSAFGTTRETRFVLPFLSGENGLQRVLSADFVERMGIGELFEDAVCEWEEKKAGYELALKGDVLKIFRHVVGYFAEQGFEFNYSSSSDNVNNLIGDILAYVNSNFALCDEKEIAGMFNLSYSYFSRTFKQIMNMSFKEYVNYLKVNEALKLLLTDSKSITEISMELGFASPSHFINVFKKEKGCSPKQYKKMILSMESANNG